MAGTISFKAYLMTEGSKDKQETRRFGIDGDVVTNFMYLREKLQSIFPTLRGQRFTVTWKDGDGDQIAISSDEELQIALNETHEERLHKLYIILHSEHSRDEPEMDREAVVHACVVCDACERNVKGFRYKCMQCVDYDLCSDCEAKGLHPEHLMLRVSQPMKWVSNDGSRLLHYLIKFVKKNAASSRREESKKESPSRCGKYREKSKASCESDPPSWIDAFPAYFTDFINLPKECSNFPKECPMKEPAHKRARDSGGSTSAETNKEKSSEAGLPINMIKMFEGITQFLDPLGIDVNIQMKTDTPQNDKPENKSESQKSTPTEENNSPKFPGEGRKLVDEKKNENASASSSSAASSSSTVQPANQNAQQTEKSPESEDWTILNKTDSPNISRTSSGASSLAGAISKETAPSAPEEVSVSEKTIYPPLPKEEQIYHPDPRIQRAVDAMMAMGFSNDGGWLTQLLVSKNGDISKALDVLQPVRH